MIIKEIKYLARYLRHSSAKYWHSIYLGAMMNTTVRTSTDTNLMHWSSQTPIPLNHSLVPHEVRKAVKNSPKPGRLYRVNTLTIVEWWLMDMEGDLLNIFWIDGKMRC